MRLSVTAWVGVVVVTVAVAGLVGVQVLVSPSERALVVAEQADTIVHQPLHNLRSHHDARGEHRDHGDAGSDHSPQQQRHQHQHQQQPHTPTRAGSSSQRDSHELPSPTTPHTDPGSSTGGATATGAAVLDPIADGDTEPPHSSSPGAVPDAPAVPAVPGVPGETPEPTPQQLGWRRGRSDTCFPSIGVVPIVPEEPPRGLTFRQLRRMLTGRCPVDVPEDTKRVLAEWKQRQHAMFKGKEPLKAGMIFTFWVAVMSRRAFIIHSRKPVNLDVAYIENDIPVYEKTWQRAGKLKGAQWRSVRVIGSRQSAVRLYQRIAGGKDTRLVSVEANAILHNLVPELRGQVQYKREFEAVAAVRLSVQLAMDTLFRPSVLLLRRMRHLQKKVPEVWQQRRPLLCGHCRTSVADGKGSRYGDGQYGLMAFALGWLYPRMDPAAAAAAQQRGDQFERPFVYIASDDPKSSSILAEYPTNSSWNFEYRQVSLPVFHIDKPQTKKGAGKESAKSLYLSVLAEHQLLAMCDGWVMPGSGFPETAFMWAEGDLNSVVWLHEDHRKHIVRLADLRLSNHIWVRSSGEMTWPTDPYPPTEGFLSLPNHTMQWREWIAGENWFEKKKARKAAKRAKKKKQAQRKKRKQ